MTSPLWDFALDFYRRRGIPAACLNLQDEAGVDVVHLIVIVYADWAGQPLGRDEIVCSHELMAEWRAKSVLPLRAVRRFLKEPIEGLEHEKEKLREAVKAVELQAEHVQLAMAEAWLKRRTHGKGLPLPQAIADLLTISSGDVAIGSRVQQSVDTVLQTRIALEPPKPSGTGPRRKAVDETESSLGSKV